MGTFRQYLTAIRFLLALTLLLGIVYPLGVFALGQLAFRNQADGSPVSRNGRVVGSSLIGQNFPGKEWFQSRPSSAGKNGYDALSSGASNLGPNDATLTQTAIARRSSIAQEESSSLAQVPPDAITSSASGLDPDISPEYAYLQAPRIAKARNISTASIDALISDHVQGRTLGFLGEAHVNVLELNLALNSIK